MIKILLVSQNTFNMKMIEKMSGELSFTMEISRDPAGAMMILERESIDLIVTSLYFPDSTCHELIERLNASPFRDVPVVVLSSTDDPSLKSQFFELGIVDFVLYENFVDSLRSYVTKIEMLKRLNRVLSERSFAILDDDQLETALMSRILKGIGASDIMIFHDPRELLLYEKKFDIYLVDLILPNMSGERVIIKLRHENPFSVIIAISSIENEKVISNVLNSGADDYLVKPVAPSDFCARIKANLRTFMLLEELKSTNATLRRLAQSDPLTGLFNRRYILEKFEEEQYRAERYRHDLTVIMMDLDFFKDINDRFGHLVGDQVLAETGGLIRHNIRKSDHAGRFGGEEFLILLPDTGLPEGRIFAEKLRKILEEHVFPVEGVTVRGSFGVSAGRIPPIDLLRLADKKLYKAKENGRNRVE